MGNKTVPYTSLISILCAGALLMSCGGSTNNFEYNDKRTPQLINPLATTQQTFVSGQKPTQIATSTTYSIRGSKITGAIQPSSGASSSFVVYVGGKSAN